MDKEKSRVHFVVGLREYIYRIRMNKYKGNYLPVYLPRHGTWVVDTQFGMKCGDASYIAEELCKMKLSYHFYNANPFNPMFPSCVDDFDKVLQALLMRPKGFSIRGFEKEYSEQEQRLLRRLKAVLMEVGNL